MTIDIQFRLEIRKWIQRIPFSALRCRSGYVVSYFQLSWRCGSGYGVSTSRSLIKKTTVGDIEVDTRYPESRNVTWIPVVMGNWYFLWNFHFVVDEMWLAAMAWEQGRMGRGILEIKTGIEQRGRQRGEKEDEKRKRNIWLQLTMGELIYTVLALTKVKGYHSWCRPW